MSCGSLAPQAHRILGQCLYQTEPEYTEEATNAGIEGMVALTGTITEEGFVCETKVTRSLGFGLDQKAIECVECWRFESPRDADGNVIRVFAGFFVSFKLQK